MHAVVVRVKLPQGGGIEEGRRRLESEVLPMVRQNAGVLHGYWLGPNEANEGLSVVFYDTEENARAAAGRLTPPPPVQLISAEVRELVAQL